MMPASDDLSPAYFAVLAALIAACMWIARAVSRKKYELRAQQLKRAAELLNVHAERTSSFLDSDAPDPELKRLLIAFSDAMADRGTVAKFAAWIASRQAPPVENNSNPESPARLLRELCIKHPELAEDFEVAIMTAATGASLRWPESAVHFEGIFTRLAAVPKSDVAIAVTGSGLRGRVPFSTRMREPAIA